VLATGGSDGTYHIWDVVTHRRLRAMPKASGPVTALCFRPDGMALAYAVGYDWSKGYMHNKPETESKIVLRVLGEAPKK
jgi:mRNA export factor